MFCIHGHVSINELFIPVLVDGIVDGDVWVRNNFFNAHRVRQQRIELKTKIFNGTILYL